MNQPVQPQVEALAHLVFQTKSQGNIGCESLACGAVCQSETSLYEWHESAIALVAPYESVRKEVELIESRQVVYAIADLVAQMVGSASGWVGGVELLQSICVPLQLHIAELGFYGHSRIERETCQGHAGYSRFPFQVGSMETSPNSSAYFQTVHSLILLCTGMERNKKQQKDYVKNAYQCVEVD